MTSPLTPSSLSYATPLYYRHSGRFSVPGVLLALLVSCAAAVVLGTVYAYVDLYNPCISVLNFLATAAFGAGIGWVTGKMLQVARVRNNVVTALLASFVALFALYVGWVVWVCAVLQRAAESGSFQPPTLLELILNPRGLIDIIRNLNEVGVWTQGSRYASSHDTPRTVKGIELTVIWLVEAVGVVGLAILVAINLASSVPYCERCGRWCQTLASAFNCAPGDPLELRRSLETKDFSYLRLLGGPRAGEGRWWTLDLYLCGGCNGMYAVTAREVRVTIDKKGRENKQTKTLVNKLLLSEEEAKALVGPAFFRAPPGMTGR
jgi:hypothetical protein